MARLIVMALACAGAMFAAGCASAPASSSADKAKPASRVLVRNGAVSTDPLRMARYSTQGRACSANSVQLLSADEVEALYEGWKAADGCDGPEKRKLPVHGASPGRKGSAHVLVRLTAEGTVESAQAVCATDAGFGEAAVETVRRIEFSPMTCAGVPTRAAFFVPLDYRYD